LHEIFRGERPMPAVKFAHQSPPGLQSIGASTGAIFTAGTIWASDPVRPGEIVVVQGGDGASSR
jgi:hypothetical protein